MSRQASTQISQLTLIVLLFHRHEQNEYVLKDVPPPYLKNWNEKIRERLPNSPYLRLPVDHIPEENILVYKYLTGDFMRLVESGISLKAAKQIIKAALTGLAELHDREICHFGMLSLLSGVFRN